MRLLVPEELVPYAGAMPNSNRLVLVPHPVHQPAPRSRLTAVLFTQRDSHALRLNARFAYEAAPGEALKVTPLRGPEPTRQDGLWKATCFELFLQPEAAAPSYWEVNFSPLGDWNVYALDGYREGLHEEPALEDVRAESFEVDDDSLVCSFSFEVPGPAGLIMGPMRLSATAVVETLDGRKTYWATKHAGDKPDFHRSESFAHLLSVGGDR